MMQGWYFAKNLTGQRHDRVQTEAKNCNRGQLFRPCWVSSARRNKLWSIKLGLLDFLVTQLSAPGSPRMAWPLIKPFFYPRTVARSKMGILKGFRRLVVGFWCLGWIFFHESLSFEHHCIKESYFVLWYFGREFYCWVECVGLFNKTLFHLFYSPKGRKHHQCNCSKSSDHILQEVKISKRHAFKSKTIIWRLW